MIVRTTLTKYGFQIFLLELTFHIDMQFYLIILKFRINVSSTFIQNIIYTEQNILYSIQNLFNINYI